MLAINAPVRHGAWSMTWGLSTTAMVIQTNNVVNANHHCNSSHWNGSNKNYVGPRQGMVWYHTCDDCNRCLTVSITSCQSLNDDGHQ
jgi:hypothetical protein